MVTEKRSTRKPLASPAQRHLGALLPIRSEPLSRSKVLSWRQPCPSLILKPASTSRPSGKWSDDDYDVLADGAESCEPPHRGKPWMWTLAFGHHEDRTPTHRLSAVSLFAIRRCIHLTPRISWAAFRIPSVTFVSAKSLSGHSPITARAPSGIAVVRQRQLRKMTGITFDRPSWCC